MVRVPGLQSNENWVLRETVREKKITPQHTLIPFQGLPFAETTRLVPILEAWIVQ